MNVTTTVPICCACGQPGHTTDQHPMPPRPTSRPGAPVLQLPPIFCRCGAQVTSQAFLDTEAGRLTCPFCVRTLASGAEPGRFVGIGPQSAGLVPGVSALPADQAVRILIERFGAELV